MSINSINGNGQNPQLESQKIAQQQAQNQTASEAGRQQATATSVPARADSVSLTQSAQQLNQVQKKGSDAPVNQEKVEKLKKAIANGEYKVNADVLADKIAKQEFDLFGSSKNGTTNS